MRRTIHPGQAALILALTLLPRALPAGAGEGGVDEPGAWAVSLEARADLSNRATSGAVGFAGLAPRVSYQLSDRLRLEGSAGFSTRDGRLETVSLEPGFRVRLWRGPAGRLRLLSGMSASIEVLDRFDPEWAGSAREGSPEFAARRRQPAAGLQLTPAELEVAAGRQSALTLTAVYTSTLYAGGRLGGGTAGLAAGVRVRFR